MKESLRRLSVVIIWLTTVICCFLVYALRSDFWFYLMWICFGVVAHKVVNWIFQKDNGGDRFDWESFGEAILEVLTVHWSIIIGVGIFMFILTGTSSEKLPELLIEFDMAKISGHLTGRLIGSCLTGYLIGVVINIFIMIVTSNFVRKIFGF